MIHLKNLVKRFGLRTVLDHINLHIAPGEFVVITGPSGSGKTTLLDLIIGAHKPTAGEITVDHDNLAELDFDALQNHRRKIGIVFQDYRLLPHKTAFENVALPLRNDNMPDHEIDKRVAELLKDVNLDTHKHTLPHELSGGQMQRIALARALAHKPKIILADEPTGNNDMITTEQIIKLLLKENLRGATVIFTTHDPHIITMIAKKTFRLENGTLHDQ